MYCSVDKYGKLQVCADEDDLCTKCKNLYKCPLIQALRKEYVFLHYSDIEIRDCGFFKKT